MTACCKAKISWMNRTRRKQCSQPLRLYFILATDLDDQQERSEERPVCPWFFFLISFFFTGAKTMFPSQRRHRDEWSRFIREHGGLMMSTARRHHRCTFPAFSSILKDSIDIPVNMFAHFIASLNEKTGVFFLKIARGDQKQAACVSLAVWRRKKTRNKKRNLMCWEETHSNRASLTAFPVPIFYTKLS